MHKTQHLYIYLSFFFVGEMSMELKKLYEKHGLFSLGFSIEEVKQFNYINLLDRNGEAVAYQMKGQKIVYLHGRTMDEDRRVLDEIFGKPEPIGKIIGLYPPMQNGDEE